MSDTRMATLVSEALQLAVTWFARSRYAEERRLAAEVCDGQVPFDGNWTAADIGGEAGGA